MSASLMTSITLVFLGPWLHCGWVPAQTHRLPAVFPHTPRPPSSPASQPHAPPLLTVSHSPGCASSFLCPPPSFSVNSLFGFHWVSPGSCHQLGHQLPFLHWALNFLQSQFTEDLKDLKSRMARPCWLLPPPCPPAQRPRLTSMTQDSGCRRRA